MLYTYISHSRVPKTYHGVTFNYGDKKSVSGVINDKRFVFCGARPNPPVSVVKESESSETVVESTMQVADAAPAEKPKSTRGRKPKVFEAVLEESDSTDKE